MTDSATSTPREYKPMLAYPHPTNMAFDDPAWLFQPKYDGIRCIAYYDSGNLRLINRAGNDVTERFPDVRAQVCSNLGSKPYLVLDGELVCMKSDHASESGEQPDFQAMQTRMNRKLDIHRMSIEHPATFIAFDMLARYSLMRSRVYDMTGDPLSTRLSHLQGTVGKDWLADSEQGDGTGMALAYSSWEGIMAKKLNSVYSPGKRSWDWLKIKNKRYGTFTILGYTMGEGKRDGLIGALLLGEVTGTIKNIMLGTVEYVGKVGTGFTDETLAEVTDAVLNQPTVTIQHEPNSVSIFPGVLYCSVEYAERTEDGKLRFPSFKGMVSRAT